MPRAGDTAESFFRALEVFYDFLNHWLRIGCSVGWEEDQLDVVQLELGRVATQVIEIEQHSASLLAESSVPRTRHLFEKLRCHPRLRVCLVLDGNLFVLEGTECLGFANRRKREVLVTTHIFPYQRSNPLLALLSSSAPFSPETPGLVRKQLPEESSLVQIEDIVCGELSE